MSGSATSSPDRESMKFRAGGKRRIEEDAAGAPNLMISRRVNPICYQVHHELLFRQLGQNVIRPIQRLILHRVAYL